jgi:hypothetical protein
LIDEEVKRRKAAGIEAILIHDALVVRMSRFLGRTKKEK